MKKFLPILIVVAVIALGVGAWLFLDKGGDGEVATLPGEVKKEAGEEGDSFTGKLKAAIALGVPMKCSYEQGDYTGTSYIKGRKVYGEIKHEDKESYVIMVDKCMWNWTKGESQGVKMCFEEDAWEGDEEGSVPAETEYRCAPAVIPNSKFDPPADVNFMDMDEMMGSMGE